MEADTGAALNADTSLSSTIPNTGSNIYVSSSHAADDPSSHPTDTQGASSVLPESSPANSTLVTSPSDNRPPSDPKSPPQLLVVLRKFNRWTPDQKLEREQRLVFVRNWLEKMTYSVRIISHKYSSLPSSHCIRPYFQEASEYIKDRSDWAYLDLPGKLKATFGQAGLDEDVKPCYIMEEDWSFLVRYASALYMDF